MALNHFGSNNFAPDHFSATHLAGKVAEVVVETLGAGLSSLGIQITEQEVFAAVIAALTVIG